MSGNTLQLLLKIVVTTYYAKHIYLLSHLIPVNKPTYTCYNPHVHEESEAQYILHDLSAVTQLISGST